MLRRARCKSAHPQPTTANKKLATDLSGRPAALGEVRLSFKTSNAADLEPAPGSRPGFGFAVKSRRLQPWSASNVALRHHEGFSPMEPMKPMEPMSGGDKWWPDDLGQPSSSGSQNRLRYAFFPETRRLLIEQDGKRTTYDSGNHQISGVQQSGDAAAPEFTSQNGVVRISDLKKIG
jgi:hypothetical protein